jgi:hypothetical protein
VLVRDDLPELGADLVPHFTDQPGCGQSHTPFQMK